jgi:glutathione synthase/RimK-type ligase-like ATP-grasp enzyme
MSFVIDTELAEVLSRARALAARAEDQAARQAYLDVLQRDPTNFSALNELGTLAFAGGFRSAARTAYQQAVRYHPGNKIARVNLANLLREEQDPTAARPHYEAALAIDPDLHEAHQGMAWVLQELGLEDTGQHWQRGYSGHAILSKPYRGTGVGSPLLMLVSARGGNIPTQLWLNDRLFAVSAIYTEFYDSGLALPPHALIVNTISDADLCDLALTRAEEIVARSTAPVINRPANVRLTGRIEIARRLAAIDGVNAPTTRALAASALLVASDLRFPLLLRRPGFHNGQHFIYVEKHAALAPSVASLRADELLVIEYLDARGADGMARKYRVMFIDGVAYPAHLAISSDWKVHYATSDMAHNAAYRSEERRFLENMPAVLGPRAMAALARICATLDLQYGGIDFALAPNGSVLLFEANATMIVFPPSPDPIWDYRRRAISDVLDAATQMLQRHAAHAAAPAHKLM